MWNYDRKDEGAGRSDDTEKNRSIVHSGDDVDRRQDEKAGERRNLFYSSASRARRNRVGIILDKTAKTNC